MSDFGNDMQAVVDNWSEKWRQERSRTQMTLGSLIKRLEELMAADEWGMQLYLPICNPHAYRGYYSDLAFETGRESAALTIENTLALCRGSLGQGFTGYKGGTYIMAEDTPVWLASWGCCGRKLISIEEGETECNLTLVTAEDEY